MSDCPKCNLRQMLVINRGRRFGGEEMAILLLLLLNEREILTGLLVVYVVAPVVDFFCFHGENR